MLRPHLPVLVRPIPKFDAIRAAAGQSAKMRFIRVRQAATARFPTLAPSTSCAVNNIPITRAEPDDAIAMSSDRIVLKELP